MPHARALLPYAAAAAIIAAGSTALVLSSVDGANLPTGSSGDTPRAAPQLSSTGRIAYWRQNPAGAFVLWAANLDGSSARPLTTLAANTSRPFGTRWTGDGRAVAYVTDLGIGVVNLDGSRADLTLPTATRNAGFKVIDQRWSPSGTRVAATLYRSTDSKSEVHLGSLDRLDLTRAGDLGNAFVADWLSDDEVLVESDTGVLGALRAPGSLRKLVDQTAASPVVHSGRILFLQGAIASGDQTGIFVVNPSIWSVGLDGKDARRETRLEVVGNLRLDGRWPDGRYLMHFKGDGSQWFGTTRLTVLAPSSLFRRVIVSADGRSAIGLGGPRIVRIDLSRGLTPTEGSFVVLLDGIFGADAWVRRALP
ncbi:MAG TPA: hypothetical protein VGR46_12430 [Candidatus Limnocylindria bacterium]|nr:hypothetical protein [Candidatus Limnocylindria bacterium]